MRALFSSVLAGLLLLSATGVRAQVPGFAGGVGDGRVAGDARAERARAVPTLTMYTDTSQPLNETFTVNFRFSEDVTDFEIDDITVANGDRGLLVSGSGRLYMVDVAPDTDFEGEVTVTVRANAVEGRNNDGNARTRQTFQVDTRAPELDDAEVDENELVVTYDEELDDTSDPRTTDFEVRVEGDDEFILRVRTVDDREVTLILMDPVSKGDEVFLDYSPGSNPIQDLAGNEVELFTRERVTNNTLSGDDLPSAPEDLTATADGPTTIELKWDAPDDDGGSDITGYRIEWSATGRAPWDILERDTDDDGTTYSDTGSLGGPGGTTTSPRSMATARARGRMSPTPRPTSGSPASPETSGRSRAEVRGSTCRGARRSLTEAAASPATRSRCLRTANRPGPCG